MPPIRFVQRKSDFRSSLCLAFRKPNERKKKEKASPSIQEKEAKRGYQAKGVAIVIAGIVG